MNKNTHCRASHSHAIERQRLLHELQQNKNRFFEYNERRRLAGISPLSEAQFYARFSFQIDRLYKLGALTFPLDQPARVIRPGDTNPQHRDNLILQGRNHAEN